MKENKKQKTKKNRKRITGYCFKASEYFPLWAAVYTVKINRKMFLFLFLNQMRGSRRENDCPRDEREKTKQGRTYGRKDDPKNRGRHRHGKINKY